MKGIHAVLGAFAGLAILASIAGVVAFIRAGPGLPPVVLDLSANCPACSAEAAARTVAAPLEVMLRGAKGLKSVRSKSVAGAVYLRLYFEPGTAEKDAIDAVVARLADVEKTLPAGIQPAFLFGGMELLRYTLRAPRDALGNSFYTAADLRTQQMNLERLMRRMAGVRQVQSFGGATKRGEIQLDPDRQKRYGVSSMQVHHAFGNSSLILIPSKDAIRLPLDAKTPQEATAKIRTQEADIVKNVRSVVITSINNVPIKVDDVVVGGPLAIGEKSTQGVIIGAQAPHSRVGIARRQPGRSDWQDEDAAVEGVVLLRPGSDPDHTRRAVLDRIKEYNEQHRDLIPGVYIEVFPGSTAGADRLWIDGVFPADVTEETLGKQLQKVRAALGEFAEVEAVLSHSINSGQSSDAGDGDFDTPGWFNHVNLIVALRPAVNWPIPAGRNKAWTRAELAQEMTTKLTACFATASWRIALTPADRGCEPFTPARGKHLLKIVQGQGSDLEAAAKDAQKVLAGIEGVENARVFQFGGPPSFDWQIDRKKCAALGIQVSDLVNFLGTAAAGSSIPVVEGEMFFDITLTVPRRDQAAILNLPLPANLTGKQPMRVLVKDLASLSEHPTPSAVYREQGRRIVAVEFEIRGRTADEVLSEAREKTVPLFKDRYQAQWLSEP